MNSLIFEAALSVKVTMASRVPTEVGNGQRGG